MGVHALVQAAAQTAFQAAGDLKKQCQYTQGIDDGLEESIVPQVFSIDVLFGAFSRAEMNKHDSIQPGDVRGLVLLAAMEVEPVTGDMLVENDSGREYRVEAWTKDMAGAFYELHMRAL